MNGPGQSVSVTVPTIVAAPPRISVIRSRKPVERESVERYLASKFGDDLKRVESAMDALAKSITRKVLVERAFDLYAEFRPAIPSGTAGWGAKGVLDLTAIRKMAG